MNSVLSFYQSERFLTSLGFFKAEHIEQIQPHTPFIFLLRPEWRSYKENSLHPYYSSCARIEDPISVTPSKEAYELTRTGMLAYFALPNKEDPLMPLLLGGNNLPKHKIESRGLILPNCYIGTRALCDKHFNLNPLERSLEAKTFKGTTTVL
jgi:hypothetical protein